MVTVELNDEDSVNAIQDFSHAIRLNPDDALTSMNISVEVATVMCISANE